MRLLASTDLALRILMRLADPGVAGPVSVETLARDLGGQSRNHLHKIVQQLAGFGVVRTVRGAQGGVLLAQSPAQVSLGRLVRALESDQPLVECFRADGGCCNLIGFCRLQGLLGGAKEAFYLALDQHTLADCLPIAPGLPWPQHEVVPIGIAQP
jgi:Rrf2 family nitric oxide-sensitive transcriptional repressor